MFPIFHIINQTASSFEQDFKKIVHISQKRETDVCILIYYSTSLHPHDLHSTTQILHTPLSHIVTFPS